MTIQITIPANPAAIEEGDFHAGIKIYGIEYACSLLPTNTKSITLAAFATTTVALNGRLNAMPRQP